MTKKERRRALPALLLSLALALCLLGGCGGEEETADPDPAITDEEVLAVLDAHSFAFYIECGEEDWYGSTTDEERIAMADDLLDMLKELGINTGDSTGNTVAQAMNDYYDQDKTKSIFDVFCTVLDLTDGPSYETLYRNARDASLEDADPLLGAWQNDEAGVRLLFHADGTFSYLDGDDTVGGTYTFDGDTLTLSSDEGVTETGWMDEDGTLSFENLDGWFYFADAAQ